MELPPSFRRAVYRASLLAAVALLPSSTQAGEDPINPAAPGRGLARTPEFQARVDRAIDAGVAWLRRIQREDGTFAMETRGRDAQWAGGPWQKGANALAVYTLAACDMPSDDPTLVRGFLRMRADWGIRTVPKSEMEAMTIADGVTTYFVSLSLMALDVAHNRAPMPFGKGRPGGKAATSLSPEEVRWVDEMVEWLCCAQDPGKGGKVVLPEDPKKRRDRGKGKNPRPVSSGSDSFPGDRGGAPGPSPEDGGGFSYGIPAEPHGYHDHSNSQFALLGLKSGARLGADIPDVVWLRTLRHFLAVQEERGPRIPRVDAPSAADPGRTRSSGEVVTTGDYDEARGWGYMCAGSMAASKKLGFRGWEGVVEQPTLAMTSGGVSSLVICRSELENVAALTPRLRTLAEKGIRDGYAWLAAHFDESQRVQGFDPSKLPPGVDKDELSKMLAERLRERLVDLYYLYGLERACVLGGVFTLCGKDWYLDGAERILKLQRENGSFLSEDRSNGNGLELVDSCFALLFLKRAVFRVPDRRVATEPGAVESGSVEALLTQYRGAESAGRPVVLSRFLALGTGVILKLILKLADDDLAIRTTAHDVLRVLTGQDLGFLPDAPSKAREVSTQSWEAWWIENENRLVADPAAGRFVLRK